MRTSKVMLNILSVVCFIYGALYIFSLVFIPIGIYCFLAGRRFSYKAEHPDDTNYMSNKIFRNYVIFVSIFCLPFGLLSIIPYIYFTGHNIKITNSETEVAPDSTEQYTVSSVESKTEEGDGKDEVVKVDAYVPTTESEKQEKFETLKRFHEKGIITDDEFEMAKQELYGKDKKD